MSEKTKNILEWILCIVIAFVLAILIKYFIGTPTIVQQVSMKPTLLSGQRLILNRWVRTTHKMPERGDIITFEAPTIKGYYTDEDMDYANPVAKYENEPTSWWKKFTYYMLEIGKESYIKRVIALPGEHVEIKEGKVYINGEELEESYLQPGVVTGRNDSHGAYLDIVVPENCVFAMGDNRTQSTDCRAFGCIPLEKIESKVWIRFWPLNLWGRV
ncbi:MAG: signal peptidase I [Clostridia bacterium]|nr:signal peptidase I [Clostridia bacterium]